MTRTQRRYDDPRERLIANSVADPHSDCWLWVGNRDRKGYGRLAVRVRGRPTGVRAHRYSYELFCGPIPDGQTVDHTCVQASCINPSHLVLLSREQNTKSMWYRKRVISTFPPRIDAVCDTAAA